MEKLVFISYSTKDKEVAFQIVEHFESRGIGCYIAPRDIQPGGSYASRLTRAICESKAIVLVASDAINNSEHVLNEIDIFVSENKYFVPFFIEEFEMNPDLRYYLGRKQRIIAYPGEPSAHFGRLLDALSSVIQIPRAMPAVEQTAAPKAKEELRRRTLRRYSTTYRKEE